MSDPVSRRTSSDSRLRLLVLHAHYAATLSYYDDWLDAFCASGEVEAEPLNVAGPDAASRVARALERCDAVVALHSTNADTLEYVEPVVGALAERRCPLGTFVGNEVNVPGSPLADKIRLLRDVGAEHIFTQLPAEAGRWLFAECDCAEVHAVPHALQPAAFRAERALEDRPIDIGVRSARYFAYLGDNERNALLDLFESRTFEPPLATDISTSARFARTEWAEFLNRCKGTVSTEAGSWYLERDDRTVNAIRAFVLEQQRAKPGVVIRADSRFRRLGHRLPGWLRAALRGVLRRGLIRHEALFSEDLPFEEIRDRFFAGRPRAPVYSKAISSRHFDAIGTRTCQIMPRGRFNDILVADRHYLALEPDLSNVDEVVRRFADPEQRREVVDAALEMTLEAHTYAHRVSEVASLMAKAVNG